MMILSVEEKQTILSKFPSFKLCYEKIAHNKVDGGVCVAIPKGPKCFVWFSLYLNSPSCILIERSREKDSIKDVSIVSCSFDHTIVGTILSGTIVNNDKRRIIVLDDVYFYKNRHVTFLNPCEKLRIIGDLFLDRKIVNAIELKTQFMFASIGESYSDGVSIYCSQYRKDSTSYVNVFINKVIQPTNRKVFKVIAESQNDIYTLYDDNDIEQGFACIPTYEVSKMMNSLFRNIKENHNLDSLEESDDEDEFENVSLDKFINDKTRVIRMECEYVPKFKKWQPIKPV